MIGCNTCITSTTSVIRRLIGTGSSNRKDKEVKKINAVCALMKYTAKGINASNMLVKLKAIKIQ